MICVEYDALRRLGITDAESYVKKTFGSTKEDMVFLPTVCCGPALLDQIEGMVEEALNTGSWIDVQVDSLLQSLDESSSVCYGRLC